jgi:hypothetical protein
MRGPPNYCLHGQAWIEPCPACGRRIRNGRREPLSSSHRDRLPMPTSASSTGRHQKLVIHRPGWEPSEAQRAEFTAPILPRLDRTR